MIDHRQTVVNNLSRPTSKPLWVVTAAPSVGATSGAVVVQAIPPGHGKTLGEKPDIVPLPNRWQYACRWAREWSSASPRDIGQAVGKLLARTYEFGRFTFLLDATECGRVFGVAVGTAAGRVPMMVLQGALGEKQVAGPEEERVLRMATKEARGALLSLASEERFFVAEMALAGKLRASLLRQEQETQGVERALSVGLWWLLRATGDGDRTPKPMQKVDDVAFDEETHRDRQWEMVDGLSEKVGGLL